MADQHFAGMFCRLVVELLERDGMLEGVLAEIGQTGRAAGLKDDTLWFSYADVRQLYEAASRALGSPDELFRAGAESTGISGAQPELTALLHDLGGLRGIWQQLGNGHAMITTIIEHTPIEIGPTEWIIRCRLHDGFEPFPELCAMSAGIIALSPRMFGLDAAEVIEEECQCRGAGACSFRVRWSETSDPTSRAGYFEMRSALLEHRLAALEERVADLVSGDSVPDLLERIADAAVASVHAPALVVAIEPLPGVDHQVIARGIDADAARLVAFRLLAGEDVRDAMVADIASSRRIYGRIAAIDPKGIALPEEATVLRSYARLAAGALDSATALAESRAQASRATALLRLAADLAEIASPDDIAARLVRAVPAVIDCDGAVVALVGEDDTISVRAAEGMGEVLGARVRDVELELPRVAARCGMTNTATVPIHVNGIVVGAVAAAVRERPERLRPSAELQARLTGLAAQAATAFRNARLVERVRHQAMHDALTGLPNRVMVADEAARLGRRGAVLFVDLDGFKDVNDTLGHEAGDRLLCAVTDRLRLAIRDTDVLGRLGGDEFVVLTPSGSPEALADRMLDVLRDPFVLEGHGAPLHVSASVGIAHAGRSTSGDLLRDADVALYEAKAAGKDRFAVYEPAMEQLVLERMELDAELRRALAEDEFFLLYQPIVELGSGRITGVEALLRWRHPERGVIAPDHFIPQLEQSGFIVDVGRCVLGEACRQATAWPGIDMSVNVSARQLEREAILDDVRHALGASGLDPSRLTIEITETAMVRDPLGTDARLRAIKELGVRVALDDFGTGYSSVAYLRQFPIDVLKIDRSFVNGLEENPALVRMLVQLGKGLGIRTSAEGIEDAGQLHELIAEECDTGQGYLFARPLDPSAVVALLDGERGTDAVAMPGGVTP